MKTSHVVAGSVGLGLWIVMMAFVLSWSKHASEVTKIPLPKFGATASADSQAKTPPAPVEVRETQVPTASTSSNAPSDATDSVPPPEASAKAPEAAPATTESWN
jgi:cytoskeletal protein RodZ